MGAASVALTDSPRIAVESIRGDLDGRPNPLLELAHKLESVYAVPLADVKDGHQFAISVQRHKDKLISVFGVTGATFSDYALLFLADICPDFVKL